MWEHLTYVKKIKKLNNSYTLFYPEQRKHRIILLFLFDFLIYAHSTILSTLGWLKSKEALKEKELWVRVSSPFLLCLHFLHKWLVASKSYLSCYLPWVSLNPHAPMVHQNSMVMGLYECYVWIVRRGNMNTVCTSSDHDLTAFSHHPSHTKQKFNDKIKNFKMAKAAY